MHVGLKAALHHDIIQTTIAYSDLLQAALAAGGVRDEGGDGGGEGGGGHGRKEAGGEGEGEGEGEGWDGSGLVQWREIGCRVL
jgi:hypothetical protein